MEQPHAELAKLTTELDAHRADAMLIQEGVAARAAIVPHTYKYKHAGWLIGQWAQDSILAACRRLLDEGRGNRSLWRTLTDLASLAPTITPDLLVSHWAALGRQFVDMSPDDVARQVLDELNGAVGSDALHTKRVHRERDQLKAAFEDVIDAANVSVAHDIPDAVFALGMHRIEAFAADVEESVTRWERLADGKESRSIGPRKVEGLTPLIHALRLFDYEDYVTARITVRKQGMSADEADAKARLRYEF